MEVPLDENEVMVKAIEVLAGLRRGDKIIVDKERFDKLLSVSERVDALLAKLDEAREAREAKEVAQDPAKKPIGRD